MTKGKKEKTIKVHIVAKGGPSVDPLWSLYKNYGAAKDNASEGDEIYSGELILVGTLRRVVQ